MKLKAPVVRFLILFIVLAQVLSCTKSYKEEQEEKIQSLKNDNISELPRNITQLKDNKDKWLELDFVRLQRDALLANGLSFIPINKTKLYKQGVETIILEPYFSVVACRNPSREMSEYFQLGSLIVNNNICLSESNKKQWNSFMQRDVAKEGEYYCWFQSGETVVGPESKYALLVADGCQKPPQSQLASVVQNTYWRGCYKRVCPLSGFDRSIDVCNISGGVYVSLSKTASETVRYTGEKAEDGNGEGMWYFFSIAKIIPPVFCVSKYDVVLGFYSDENKDRRRIGTIQNNTVWDDETKRNLIKGLIFRGMSLGMIFAVLGEPDNIAKINNNDRTEQVELRFRGRTGFNLIEATLIFIDNKLTDWRQDL